MIRRLRHLWGVLPYFLIPAAGALSPLLVIPAVTSTAGAQGWSAMAIGQAVGGAAAIVGELGWGVVGPQRLPKLGSRRRASLYRIALATRLIAGIPLAVLAGLSAFFLAPHAPVDAAFLAVGTALSSLSPMWFFIGTNQPLRILASESVPKLLTALIAGVLILNGADLVVFGALTILQVVFTLLFSSRSIEGKSFPSKLDFTAAPAAMRKQLSISVGRSVSVVYTYLPTAIAAAVAPAAVPAFAAADRLMRMSLSILAGIPSRLQSWLGSSSSENEARRRSLTLRLNTLLGLVSGISFMVLVPWVGSLVFAGEVPIEPALAASAGILLAVICTSRGLGLVLVSLGGAAKITRAIVPSAVTGLLVVIPLAAWAGAVGIVVAGILAECVGVAVQYLLIKKMQK